MNETSEFPFSWQLNRNTGYLQAMADRCISNMKINTEWSLVCVWSQPHPYKPKCLEIHRISTNEEVLVSGAFNIICDGNSVLLRKFVQLIEVGFTTTQINLEYSIRQDYYYDTRNFTIDGTLKISANTANEKYAKGAQFKTLLNLSDDFECLLDPNVNYFSDVNLNCCDLVSIPAHKNILSARSPVFAAMFTNQMKENRENKVNITDLSPHVLKTMLHYIYSGKTGKLSVQSAGELMFAADKYQLQDLKRVCSDYLKSCASAENVLRSLVLGYLHDNDLKVFAMDFICNSCEEFEVLEKTEEWKNLREKMPSLAMDVLTSLVKSKGKTMGRHKSISSLTRQTATKVPPNLEQLFLKFTTVHIPKSRFH